MKKAIYIALAGLLGVLVGFILHALIEIPAIYFMIGDFGQRDLNLDWSQLMLVHYIFTGLFLVGGLTAGIASGSRWWQYIYVERKYTGRWFKIK
jgi:hypothetical protein